MSTDAPPKDEGEKTGWLLLLLLPSPPLFSFLLEARRREESKDKTSALLVSSEAAVKLRVEERGTSLKLSPTTYTCSTSVAAAKKCRSSSSSSSSSNAHLPQHAAVVDVLLDNHWHFDGTRGKSAPAAHNLHVMRCRGTWWH